MNNTFFSAHDTYQQSSSLVITNEFIITKVMKTKENSMNCLSVQADMHVITSFKWI